MLTQDRINELKELLAKGTPGPLVAKLVALKNAAPELLDAAEEAVRLRVGLSAAIDDLLTMSYENRKLKMELERVKFDLDSTKKGGAVIGDLLNKERDENKRLREALETAQKDIYSKSVVIGTWSNTCATLETEQERLRGLVNVMRIALVTAADYTRFGATDLLATGKAKL